MLLRRFYISENSTGALVVRHHGKEKLTYIPTAPKPKKKSNRVLKTEIPGVVSTPSSPASFLSRTSTPALFPEPTTAPATHPPPVPTV